MLCYDCSHGKIYCGECELNEFLQHENDILHEELDNLRKALKFYADEKTYRLGVMITMGSAFPLHEPIKSDKGALARQALKAQSN